MDDQTNQNPMGNPVVTSTDMPGAVSPSPVSSPSINIVNPATPAPTTTSTGDVTKDPVYTKIMDNLASIEQKLDALLAKTGSTM